MTLPATPYKVGQHSRRFTNSGKSPSPAAANTKPETVARIRHNLINQKKAKIQILCRKRTHKIQTKAKCPLTHNVRKRPVPELHAHVLSAPQPLSERSREWNQKIKLQRMGSKTRTFSNYTKPDTDEASPFSQDSTNLPYPFSKFLVDLLRLEKKNGWTVGQRQLTVNLASG